MTNTTASDSYIIQTATAKMPGSCWGRYGKIAILRVENGVKRVSMISKRAKGCLEVVCVWDRLHIGRTDRCAFSRAMRDAEEMLAEIKRTRP